MNAQFERAKLKDTRSVDGGLRARSEYSVSYIRLLAVIRVPLVCEEVLVGERR